MQKGFIVLAGVIVSIGIGWFLIHRFGSGVANTTVGLMSAGVIVIAIILVLFTQFKKKK